MPQIPDATRSLVWSVVLVLFLRFASVYGFVFLSANFGVLLRATIHVQAGTKPASSGRRPDAVGTRNDGRRPERNRQIRDPSNPSKPTPSQNKNTRRQPPIIIHHHRPTSPPPYSLAPPKSQNDPLPQSILKLYEDIMAADAQTIQVQQETMCAQQETIRAQTQMIKTMRRLLESQDERIEELEGLLGIAEDGEVDKAKL